MTNWNALLLLASVTSKTLTVKLYVPAVVGFPVSAPPVEIAKPGGGVPDVIEKTYPGTPPVAANGVVYGRLTVQGGRGEAVVITGGAATTVTLNALVAVALVESVAVMENE